MNANQQHIVVRIQDLRNNNIKEKLKTFIVIDKPFSITKDQRQEYGKDISKENNILKKYVDCVGFEVLDDKHYYNENSLSRFYVDFDFKTEEEAPKTLQELQEEIEEPFKKVFGDDFNICFSGYSNNLNYYLKFINHLGTCCCYIGYKENTNKILSLHAIVLNKYMSPDSLIKAGKYIKELMKDKKFKIDTSVYKSDKKKEQLFRPTIFNKPDQKNGVDFKEFIKKKKQSFKTLLYYTAVCYFEKDEEIEEYIPPEFEESTINQQNNQKTTTNQQEFNEELIKIIKDKDTKKFNEEYSIFDFCGVDGWYQLTQLLYSISDNNDLPIIKKNFDKELKIWYNKRTHDKYKTFKEFEQHIEQKPTIKTIDSDKMFIKLNSLTKQHILSELLPALNLMKQLKTIQNKIKKEKNITKEERKRLYKHFIEFLGILSKNGETITNNVEENDEIHEMISKIYDKINEDNIQKILKPLSIKRGFMELYENKLNTIKEKFLKARFIHFCDCSDIPQYQIAYVEDINKFYFKDKTLAEDTLKRKKIDTTADFPMFENVLTLQQQRYKYKGKTSENVLNVEEWMKIFKDSFDSEDMFIWYMSWFHHKFNNRVINKNILNIGDKNCLKTSFIEYFSLIFDIRKSTPKQVKAQFNGSILEGKIVFIDEIQDLTQQDLTEFVQFIKDKTSTDIVSYEKKFENVETTKEKKFDIIMNTNIWSLPNLFLSGDEADKMLKRIKIIKRKELPIKILKDTEKFPDISKDIGFKYQLYKFIKHWEFKDIKPVKVEEMRIEEKLSEFEQTYQDINKPDVVKFNKDDFSDEIKNNKIIKKGKDNRYIFTFTDFKNFLKNHRDQEIEVNIFTKKGKEDLLAYLNKYNISFDSKTRFKETEDVNRFLKHFTEFETFEQIQEYIKEKEKKEEEERQKILKGEETTKE